MTHPITELIQQRYSGRAYVKTPLAPEQAGSLAACAAAVKAGPLGAPLRFTPVAAAEGDSRTLRGLGAYGLIKNPAGFLIGAIGPGEQNLEDFGALPAPGDTGEYVVTWAGRDDADAARTE